MRGWRIIFVPNFKKQACKTLLCSSYGIDTNPSDGRFSFEVNCEVTQGTQITETASMKINVQRKHDDGQLKGSLIGVIVGVVLAGILLIIAVALLVFAKVRFISIWGWMWLKVILITNTISKKKWIRTCLPTSLTIFNKNLWKQMHFWSTKRKEKKFLSIPFLEIVWKVATEWIWTLKMIASQKKYLMKLQTLSTRPLQGEIAYFKDSEYILH